MRIAEDFKANDWIVEPCAPFVGEDGSILADVCLIRPRFLTVTVVEPELCNSVPDKTSHLRCADLCGLANS